MMKKKENPIDDILLHDKIKVSKNTPNRNNKLKSENKYPIDVKLTLPKNTLNVFNGISFITDFEGRLKFINPSFLTDRDIEESWFVNRNSMDCIHSDDMYVAVENLIKLIQENDACISFNCRTGFGVKPYRMMTWNITCSGQLLFFDISEFNNLMATPNKVELKKDTLEDYYFDAIYWKMEVSKSINDWDKKMFRYLDYCTEIKR